MSAVKQATPDQMSRVREQFEYLIQEGTDQDVACTVRVVEALYESALERRENGE